MLFKLLVTNAEMLSAQPTVWTNMNKQKQLKEDYHVFPDLNKQP